MKPWGKQKPKKNPKKPKNQKPKNKQINKQTKTLKTRWSRNYGSSGLVKATLAVSWYGTEVKQETLLE